MYSHHPSYSVGGIPSEPCSSSKMPLVCAPCLPVFAAVVPSYLCTLQSCMLDIPTYIGFHRKSFLLCLFVHFLFCTTSPPMHFTRALPTPALVRPSHSFALRRRVWRQYSIKTLYQWNAKHVNVHDNYYVKRNMAAICVCLRL